MRRQVGSAVRRAQAAVESFRELAFDRLGIPAIRKGRISKRVIARYLPARAVIVDCGAHDGSDTVSMARRWPDARVYAFEPVPELFRRLSDNTRPFPNVTCFPAAISDRAGVQTMHVSTGDSDGSSSLLAPAEHLVDHPNVRFEQTIEVPTTTFDQWSDSESVPRVDMFWLDMQGFELPALRASPRLLRGARVVHAEVSMKVVYHGVALYPELRAWMKAQGFRVALEAIPPGWDMGNVLFVRP